MSPSRTSLRRRIAAAGLSIATVAGIVPLVPASPALAEALPLLECTKHWFGAADTDSWHEPSNWSEVSVPTVDDVVCVESGNPVVTGDAPVRQLRGAGTVTLSNDADLRISEGGAIERIEVVSGRLQVAAGDLQVAELEHWAGTVEGAGSITVTRELEWSGGTQLGGATGLTQVAETATATLVGGSAAWGDRSLQIDGAVELTGSSIDFGTAPVRLANATFQIGGDVLGQNLTVDGATVLSTVALPPGVQLRGEWVVAPNAYLVLEEAAIRGTIDVTDEAGVSIGGEPDGDDEATTVVWAGGSISGGGSVLVNAGAKLHLAGTTDVGSLTVAGAVTVEAEAAAGTLDVTGSMHLQEGAEVRAALADIDAGAAGGVVVRPDAALTTANPVTLRSGTLLLEGAVSRGLDQSGGTLAISGSPTIHGRYRQTGGELQVVVEDEVPGHVTVGQDATLAGTLTAPDAPRDPGWSEAVLTAASVEGAFTEVTAGPDDCPDGIVTEDQVLLRNAPCLDLGWPTAAEDDGLVAVSVAIPEALAESYSFNYATQPGTALAGSDFVARSGTATIPAGETQTTVEIALVDDDDAEDDETFDLAVTGSTEASATASSVTIVDDDERIDLDSYSIDVLAGGLIPTGSNANGVVGRSASDADTGDSWLYSFEERVVDYISGLRGREVFDVNEPGQIVSVNLIRQRGGELRAVPSVPGTTGRAAYAINDAGVLAGTAGIGQDRAALVRWDADGTPQILPTPEARHFAVSEINEDGVIVGGFLPVDGTGMTPFRYDEGGFEVLAELDGAGWTEALSVNDDGLVVGHSGRRAVTWAPDGTLTDLGPGRATDVNDDGIVVGASFDEDPAVPFGYGEIATAWIGTTSFDLNDHVPDDRGLHLQYGYEINDVGDIAVRAFVRAGDVRTVVLRPFDCAPCISSGFEEPTLDGGGFAPLFGATTEGNPVQLEARIDNPTTAELDVEVDVLDELTGESVLGGPSTRAIASGGRSTVRVDIDTDGMAWSNGTPAPARTFRIVVEDVATGRTLTEQRTSLLVDPRPVVLVHGLWSDASTWSSYPAMVRAAHPRWDAFAVDTMDTASALPNSVAENAAELAAFVESVREATGAWSVDIVGHSMGGLIGRQYIQEQMPTYFLDEAGEDERPVVRDLVMLGTPNLGSPCAWLAPVPATLELRPEVVALFNQRTTERKGVDFSIGYGEHLPFTCASALPGDDVVPTISATYGIEDGVAFGGMAHTSMTSSQEMFDGFVRPRLQGTAIAGSETAGLRAAAAAAAEEPTLPTEPELQAIWLDAPTVPAGATDRVGLTVPAGAGDVAAVVTAPGTIGLELVDEKGVVVASSAGDPIAPTTPAFRTLRAPGTTGRWILRVHNTGPAPVQVGVGVVATGLPVTLSASAEQVHWSGRVAVTADYDAPAGVSAPTVLTGKVRHSAGTASVDLYDDGLHADGAAGDGRYRGVVRDIPDGPVVTHVAVQTTTPMRMLAASAATVVTVALPTENKAPVASAAEANVAEGSTVSLTLPAVDPDDDDLTFQIVDGPDHGQIGGRLPFVSYRPNAGFRGTDTITFTASDGRVTSAPATVTFVVGDPVPDIRFVGPFPAEAGQGQEAQLRAVVFDRSGAAVPGIEVTFAVAGRSFTSTTGIGGNAAVSFTADMASGDHEVVITTPAGRGLAAGRQTTTFTVLASRAPAPALGFVDGDEAGYPVRYVVAANDPDGDVVRAEWDLDADGDVDATTDRFDLGRAILDHVPAAAYTGPVTVTMVDSVGNRGATTFPVVIKANRPLGSMARLAMPDGSPVRPLDWDRTGRYVLVEALVPGVTNPVHRQLVVLDRTTGEVEVASKAADGAILESQTGAISPDGRFVAFSGGRRGQAGVAQTYLRDLEADTTTLVSQVGAVSANESSRPHGVAEGGASVLFTTDATNLGGTCGCQLGYRWTKATDALEIVTRGLDRQPAEVSPVGLSMDRNGTVVAYAARIEAGTSRNQVLVHDLRTGAVTLASAAIDGSPGGGDSGNAHLDDAGTKVVFASAAGDLVTGDADGWSDTFVRDLVTGTTRRLTGAAGPATASSSTPSISGDGRFAVFASGSSTLVPGDTNGRPDIFRTDLGTGQITLVSREPRDGVQSDGDSNLRVGGRFLTCDGASVLFESGAGNLVPGDVQHGIDGFVDGGIVRCGTTPPTEEPPTEEPPTEEPPTEDPDPTPDFDFQGFFQPVDNLPAVNTVQAGRAIPVKFSLGGDHGLDVFEDGYPGSRRVACDNGATTDAIEQTVSPGSSELSYEAGADRYQYVWKTEKSWKGQCRLLVVRFVDGTEATAMFRFR